MLQFFRIIDEQADHMRRLISDLLDAGRIETGTLSVTLEPTSVATLVDQARKTFLSGGGRHTIRIDLPPDLPRVMADSRRIVQVMNNLLSNSSRYFHETSPIRISAVRDDVYVAISVSDKGQGVPSELLPITDRVDQVRPLSPELIMTFLSFHFVPGQETFRRLSLLFVDPPPFSLHKLRFSDHAPVSARHPLPMLHSVPIRALMGGPVSVANDPPAMPPAPHIPAFADGPVGPALNPAPVPPTLRKLAFRDAPVRPVHDPAPVPLPGAQAACGFDGFPVFLPDPLQGSGAASHTIGAIGCPSHGSVRLVVGSPDMASRPAGQLPPASRALGLAAACGFALERGRRGLKNARKNPDENTRNSYGHGSFLSWLACAIEGGFAGTGGIASGLGKDQQISVTVHIHPITRLDQGRGIDFLDDGGTLDPMTGLEPGAVVDGRRHEFSV